MDSNQGYNLYKWVICPLTRVINLHITIVTKYPEPLSNNQLIRPDFLGNCGTAKGSKSQRVRPRYGTCGRVKLRSTYRQK